MTILNRLALAAAAIASLFAPLPLAARQAQTQAQHNQALPNQPAPLAPPAEAAPVTKAHPALWKVADSDTTIYLFGTIHLLPQGVDWFSGPLADAFASSSELVTEIPEYSDTETAMAVMKHAMLPPGQSLRAGMAPREKVKFNAAMRRLGLPESAFDRFRPWYAAVVMTTLPLQRQGYDLQNGVEAQLGARNAALNHPRTGLETLEYQLGLFDTLSPKVQKRYLSEVIDSLPSVDKEVRNMIAAWAKGDAAGLADLLNAEQDDPAMLKALLYDRNKAWAQWIKARLGKPGTVFIAVGAGHLGGKGSVQDELAKAGIAAARVQ
ncbi:MAG: TraB/GumN family protein [Proteobacteria bacterium]|nr:TraB/GumN family protein [Pseudomonadota bacterium]